MKFWKNKIIISVLIGVAIFGVAMTQAKVAEATSTDPYADLEKMQSAYDLYAGSQAPAAPQPLPTQGKEISGLLLIIVNMVSKVLVLMAGLFDFAVGLGNDVLNLAAVKVGWTIVLSFTNLGFVLAIIVIAFATIFRMESYAMKQTLWKLIVAALLVNFSLVIAGAFISVSTFASERMIDQALGKDGVNLSNALGQALNPSAFGEVKKPDGFWDFISDFSLGGLLESFLQLIASLLFVIIFSFLIILVFSVLFIMLLVRAIALIFLVILSPIVWLCWIFPSTKKYWDEWWQKFIHWNIFPVAVFFFIYLAVATAACISPNNTCPLTKSPGVALSSITNAKKAQDSAALAFEKGTITGPGEKEGRNAIFDHVANLFVVLGLLFGGLIAAQKLGVIGSKTAIAIAKRGGKEAGLWMGRKGVRGAGWGFRSPETDKDGNLIKNNMRNRTRLKIQEKLKTWKNPPPGEARGPGPVNSFLRLKDRVQGGIAKQVANNLSNLGGAYSRPGNVHKINKGFVRSVFGGMKDASGLFKKKKPQKFKLPSGEIISMMPADEDKKEEKEEQKKAPKVETKN